jgi:hypothetical protein
MVDWNRFRPVETDSGTKWIDLAQPWLQPMNHAAAFLSSEDFKTDEERKAERAAERRATLSTAAVFAAWQREKTDQALQHWLRGIGVDPGKNGPTLAFIDAIVPMLKLDPVAPSDKPLMYRALEVLAGSLSSTPELDLKVIVAQIDRLGGIGRIANLPRTTPKTPNQNSIGTSLRTLLLAVLLWLALKHFFG